MVRPLLLLLVAGCAPAVEPPAPLFESRSPYPPMLERLRAAGGDPARILRPARGEALLALESGKPHKYVVRRDGSLAIAPLPVSAPGNEYHHAILAAGEPVRAAGWVVVVHAASRIERVTVDQHSTSYCPTPDSTRAALEALGRLRVDPAALRVANRPPDCIGERPAMKLRYGALMSEVGRRFELLGRAALAGRAELAAFELHELEEALEELPRLPAPSRLDADAARRLRDAANAFSREAPPVLAKALADPSGLARGYAQVAGSCNACHRNFGHPFIEIPTEPGRGVPRLDPVR